MNTASNTPSERPGTWHQHSISISVFLQSVYSIQYTIYCILLSQRYFNSDTPARGVEWVFLLARTAWWRVNIYYVWLLVIWPDSAWVKRRIGYPCLSVERQCHSSVGWVGCQEFVSVHRRWKLRNACEVAWDGWCCEWSNAFFELAHMVAGKDFGVLKLAYMAKATQQMALWLGATWIGDGNFLWASAHGWCYRTFDDLSTLSFCGTEQSTWRRASLGRAIPVSLLYSSLGISTV